MSVNPNGMDEVDYSDFEYQQIYFKHGHENLTGDDSRSRINFEANVLDGAGGLDNNEVAELVYMDVLVNIEHQQSNSDQNVGSETQFNGVVGANLPNSGDLLQNIGAAPDGTILETNNTDAVVAGSVDSEDRVFAGFDVVKHPAFDDETNGVGGAGAAQTLQITKNFRQITGRGPVLDSSDSMNVTSQLLQEDELVPAEGQCQLYCVWDVAETSDAGRAFSVPMDD